MFSVDEAARVARRNLWKRSRGEQVETKRRARKEAAESMRIGTTCCRCKARPTRCVLTPRVYISDPSKNLFCCLVSAAFLARAAAAAP